MHVNAAVPDQIKGSALLRGCFHGSTIKRNPGWANVWRCSMCELAWLSGLSLNGVWVHLFSAGAQRQMKERQAVLSRKMTPVTADGLLHVLSLLILVFTLCRQGTLKTSNIATQTPVFSSQQWPKLSFLTNYFSRFLQQIKLHRETSDGDTNKHVFCVMRAAVRESWWYDNIFKVHNLPENWR